MKTYPVRRLAVAVMLCVPALGMAATTCSALSSAGFSTAIGAKGLASDSTLPNITSFTFSITCTRALAGDPASVRVWANDGANPTGGGQNRARFPGGTRLNYEVYPNSDCATGPIWTDAGVGTCTAAAGCISVPLVVGLNTISTTVYGCVPTGQNSASSGNYQDTVSIRIRNAANSAWLIAATSFPVTITNPASCSITSVGDVNFSYTSFQPGASTASSTITMDCTPNLPYQMALDAYSGTVIGLNYTLDINSATPPVSARGSGPGQTHTINGSIAGNQSGTCANAVAGTDICNGSQGRTLTVTW